MVRGKKRLLYKRVHKGAGELSEWFPKERDGRRASSGVIAYIRNGGGKARSKLRAASGGRNYRDSETCTQGGYGGVLKAQLGRVKGHSVVEKKEGESETG